MTQHLGKNIKYNPIKWPNRLNPAFGLKKNNAAFFSVYRTKIKSKNIHYSGIHYKRC